MPPPNRKFSSTDFELTTLTNPVVLGNAGRFQIRRRNLNKGRGRSHSKHGKFLFCTWEHFRHSLTKRVCLTTKDLARPFCSWDRFAWRHKWRPGLSGVLFHADSKDLVNFCMFKVIFYGFYHGKSPFFTTIWGICLIPNHRTSKSKTMMGIKLPFSHGPAGDEPTGPLLGLGW